jgi:hypothetical protein
MCSANSLRGFARLVSKPWLCATCGMCDGDGLHQEAHPNRLTVYYSVAQLHDLAEYFHPHSILMLHYIQDCCISNILMRSCQASLQAQTSNGYLRDKLERRCLAAAAFLPADAMSSSS